MTRIKQSTKPEPDGQPEAIQQPTNSNRRTDAVKKVGGGALAIVGFLLSPLSWWNDLLVNIPLAYLIAAPIYWLWPKLFGLAFALGYLLTNLLGFVLMHHGVRYMFSALQKQSIKREFKKDILWSVLYTVLILILVLTGLIKPPQAYFGQ